MYHSAVRFTVSWKEHLGASDGDLILILAGDGARTTKAMSELRLEILTFPSIII